MLVGQHPTLLEIDPRFSGSSSVDRETDFRKPLAHQSEGRKPEPDAVIFPSLTVPTQPSATSKRSAVHSLTS